MHTALIKSRLKINEAKAAKPKIQRKSLGKKYMKGN